MKIVFTKKEALKIFHDSLCNGLSLLRLHGLDFSFSDAQYKISRRKLRKCCYEDVLLQMLKDGFPLSVTDIEGDGEYSRTIKMSNVLKNIPLVQLNVLADTINGNGDVYTADHVLQTVFFGKVIFG